MKGLASYDKANCFNIAGAQAMACVGEMTLFSTIIVTTLLSLNYVRRKSEPTVAWFAITLSGKKRSQPWTVCSSAYNM